MEEQIGKITRLDRFGLGMVLLEGSDGEVKPFTFDKIQGYRGETLKELKKMGLKTGAIVKCRTEDEGRIDSVKTLFFKE